MDQYNESLSMDRVFYAQDIKGSIAYARANVKTGILTQEEFEVIEGGLREVSKEWEEGKFKPAPGDEGKQALVHMSLVPRPPYHIPFWRSIAKWKEIFTLRTSADLEKLSAPT
jgi:hypothetical protein